MSSATSEQQLKTFIAKFEPSNQRLIRSVRKWMRQRMPSANELVYDNYNFFVIGYCPSLRPTDSILSIAAGANGVGISFGYIGTKIPDPHKILLGAGKLNRFIRVESMETLERPEVQALITAAIGVVKVALPATGKGTLVIRSISAKQRPRRG